MEEEFDTELWGELVDSKKLGRCCRLEYESQQQQMIMNGQMVVKESKLPYFQCPTCKNVIAQLPVDSSVDEIVRMYREQLEGKVNYCSYCGQHLLYPKFYLAKPKTDG